MAQKLLKTKKTKITPKKDALKETSVVLVGTYSAEQMKKWILPKGYYNYPVGKEDDCTPEHCKRIKELWLYKGKSARKVFSAEFLGVKTRVELPDYPATKTKPHGEKYLLFKVAELYGPQLEDATVHVRVSDFTKRTPKIAKAIKAFQEGSKAKPKTAKHLQALGAASILAEVLPVEIGQVPPERLCVREAAVQLCFVLQYSNNADVKLIKKDKDLPIISLFSGAGGLDIGFDQAGFRTAVMVEFDPACCRTLRKNMPNTPVLEGDINQIGTDQILSAAGLSPLDAALVIGGPPCQSFSLAGKRMGLNDPRGRLVLEFIRVVREALPKAFVMENVRGLTNWEKGKALDAILAEAQEPIVYDGKTYSYKVAYKILNAADYGAPQFRERVFIVGNRVDCDYVFPKKEYGSPDNAEGLKPYVTVRDAICQLPPATPPSEVALRVSGTIKARIEKHGY